MKLQLGKPVFLRKISQIGVLLLFIWLNQNTVFAMGVKNMSAKGNPIIELPKIEVSPERFQSKNYTGTNKILSVEDETYLNKAIIATINIVSGKHSLESEHANLGQYRPFAPKNGPMKYLDFLTGDILYISLSRINENSPWDKADITFTGHNLILNPKGQNVLKGLPVKFMSITEEKLPSVMIEVEGKKVQSYKPYYAYHYHLIDQPNIEIIFGVWPDDMNKKATFPLIFRAIYIIHHN